MKNDVSVARGSQTRMHYACVSDSDSMMKSVLLLLTPSLKYRSKLKGQCTDVVSGCVTSVGPSLNPQSQFKKNSRATVPLSSELVMPVRWGPMCCRRW